MAAWFDNLFRSLGFKLVLTSLAVEVAMLLALVVSDINALERSFVAQTEVRVEELARLLGASLAGPLVERDLGTVQDLLSAEQKEEDIDYLVLVDATGRILANRGWKGEGLPLLSSPLRLDAANRRWDISFPITLGGQTYGRLYAGISLTPYVVARHSMLQGALGVAGLAIFASTVLFSLIGYWLTWRLRQVSLATEAIAARDHSARVPVHGSRDEVERLGHSFNAMADALEAQMLQVRDREEKLERSNAELRQFAHVAAHDLQEPLRNITNYMGLLERRYAGKLDAEAEDSIRIATTGARRMHRLIRDLREFVEVGWRDEPPVPTDLGRLLSNAMVALAEEVEETGAQVAHDPLPTLTVDGPLIERVFRHLLANALRYRAPDRVPSVSITAREDGKEWVFAVADNGIGIAPEYFERIFRVFQRLHTPEAYEGTGIGLALCKKIVEHHHGRLWVESEPGAGSTFFFTLPA